MPLKDIEIPTLSHLQILDEEGKLDETLDPGLNDDALLDLYRHMMRARVADERMLKLQRQGRIGTFGPCTGQEASACGVTFAMTGKDWFVGAFRELGGRLMRGEPFRNYLTFHNGFEEGAVLDPALRTLPISIIVGAQTLHAVGLAYAMKYRGETDSAVVVFMGDGATSEGDFHEALNFASVWQVPVVFVVQNNQWAISVPLRKQTRSKTLAQKALAYEMPGIQVDGNDPLAMYKAADDALKRARSGGGPTLIEAVTYRLMMHTTADDPTKYRNSDEEEVWWKRDPLKRFRVLLESRKLWDETRQTELVDQLKAEVDAEVKAFEAITEFRPDACFDHVFAEETPALAEQRAEFLGNLGKEVPRG